MLNKRAKFGAKILTLFWEITIFVLERFILTHPVYSSRLANGKMYVFLSVCTVRLASRGTHYVQLTKHGASATARHASIGCRWAVISRIQQQMRPVLHVLQTVANSIVYVTRLTYTSSSSPTLTCLGLNHAGDVATCDLIDRGNFNGCVPRKKRPWWRHRKSRHVQSDYAHVFSGLTSF